jgi:hypothetical protein
MKNYLELQEALLALGPHGESVDIKTAGKWVFMCGGCVFKKKKT